MLQLLRIRECIQLYVCYGCAHIHHTGPYLEGLPPAPTQGMLHLWIGRVSLSYVLSLASIPEANVTSHISRDCPNNSQTAAAADGA